jgi:hypothetical protein
MARVEGLEREVMEPMPYFIVMGRIAIMGWSTRVDEVVSEVRLEGVMCWC